MQKNIDSLITVSVILHYTILTLGTRKAGITARPLGLAGWGSVLEKEEDEEIYLRFYISVYSEDFSLWGLNAM
jgi:hypothetical protein